MSIDKITAQILGDAETEAKATVAEAKQKAEKLIGDAEKKGEEMIADATQRGEKEQEIMVSKIKSVAGIDGRKLVLEEKRKLITKCFEDAAEKILAMEDDDYASFLLDIVKASGITKGEIVLNEADKTRCADKLSGLLDKEFSGHGFVVSEETRKIKGGLMIKNGNVYANGSLEEYMEQMHDELAAEIEEILFP